MEDRLTEIPRAVIKQSRSIKEAAKEEHVGLKGNLGFELKGIVARASEVASLLESTHPEFIESQRSRFKEYLKDIPEDRVRMIYEDGLAVFFKQQYRLFKKVNPDDVAKLKDHNYLADEIVAYTFDFFQLLKVAEELDIAPQTGLQLAQKAYRINPTSVLKLINEFPELELWIKIRAITKHSLPEEHLMRVRNIVEELKPKFSQFSPSDLMIAAAERPVNTEGFLRDAWAKAEDMRGKFPDFSQPLLISIVLRHITDPEGFLTRTRGFLDTLTQKFPELSRRNLLEVAIRYENPEAFLSSLPSRVDRLAKQFPEFYRALIVRAALQHKKSERFLLSVRATVERLATQFPEFSKTDVAQVAFMHTSDPGEFLRRARTVIDQLVQESPDSDKSAIRRVALFHPDNPRARLRQLEIKKAP